MRLVDKDKLLHQGYDYVVDGIAYDSCNKSMDIEDIPTVKAIPILDGVTNGDMIKAMFPNMYSEECEYDIFTTLDGDTRFTYDWWDSPYKG